MRDIVIIAHNLRSTHNVGSLLRTAEGLGISRVYLTGYTPHPDIPQDDRLPHLVLKLSKQINKTALGAEHTQDWLYAREAGPLINELRQAGYTIAALEQAPDSQELNRYQPSEKVALVIGREVEGIEPEVRALCDLTLEIPMFGRKESFNVVQAAAMALYHCRFYQQT